MVALGKGRCPRAGRVARGFSIAVLLALGALWVPASPAIGQVKPFGTLDCVLKQSNLRYCQGSVDKRVKSFDGVPLDVNVTLPASGDRYLPLVIQLHGWGGVKLDFSRSKEWASSGYAVLSFTARGFGASCGSPDSRLADPGGCAEGWTHVSDVRYEIRDAQYLAGLLADQSLILPHRIGVWGNSYGGTQALQLATLRDNVVLQDGSLAPWRSPARGLSMSVAAAVSSNGWSDLASSLMPNGHGLDYTVPAATDERSPVGVLKDSFSSWFYTQGAYTGYYAPAGVDPSADITGWYDFFHSGEPYDSATGDPLLTEMQQYHSSAYLDTLVPAPTLVTGGFTDDFVPADEQLRWVNSHPGATIAQLYSDLGHARAQKKMMDQAHRGALAHAWFDSYVKGGSATPPSGVEAWTQTCPDTAPSGGPYTAPSWSALHPGEVRFKSNTAKLVFSSADALGGVIDPVSGADACVATSSDDQDGTATYRLPQVTEGYTLMGSPTVIANMTLPPSPPGSDTLLAARLWDVAPDRTQTLVSRSLFRPSANGQVVFQLHPNGWHFAAGHIPKLELLGQDSPYARASNFSFNLRVSNLDLRLPTAEPADSDQIKNPLPHTYPPGSTPAP
jgi:cephalosporin-C deacetylase-like acetyl esterase